MRTLRYFLLFIILLFGVLSCRDVRLSDIESYIDSRPDSALAAIRQIDTTALRGRAVKAKYSLLHAMALDKNYIDTADTRIVQPAVDWYSRHGSPEEKLKAWMYLGTEQYNGKQYNKAIVSFNQAKELEDEVSDHNLLGILNSRIADTFTQTHDNELASTYIEQSVQWFRSCGRVDQVFKEKVRKASNLAQQRKWKEADSLYRCLLVDSTTVQGSGESVEIDYSMFLLTSPFGDDNLSLQLINKAFEKGKKLRTHQEYYAYAYLLGSVGRKKESDSIWTKLDSVGNDRNRYYYNYWKHRTRLKDQDFKGAYSYLSLAMQARDSVTLNEISQSASNSERDYLKIINAEKDLKLRYERVVIVLITLLCIILFLIVYLLRLQIDKRNRKLFDEQERMRIVVDSLRNQIADKEYALDRIKKIPDASKGRAKFILLADIYERVYRRLTDESDFEEALRNALHKYIGDLRNDPKARNLFKNLVDKEMDGIMTKFKKDFPDLSESEYDMASYYFAGFDNTSVMIIMNISSISNTRTMKSRLKQKINSSGIKGKATYSALL